MKHRRLILFAAASGIFGTTVIFAVMSWQDASYLATGIAAVVAIATLGATVYGTTGDRRRPRIEAVETGDSVAAPDGTANSGITVDGDHVPGGMKVEQSGEAQAERRGVANTGIRVGAEPGEPRAGESGRRSPKG
ncbi:hypothetical protein [Haloglycomyces albus]|uniref:hypothetical protein n=1 Tax=Haloglycomyces albus TaxID=526067 RepID=UPI00046D1BD7|nr:hypothetical protein [Haloglycomyces albus]